MAELEQVIKQGKQCTLYILPFSECSLPLRKTHLVQSLVRAQSTKKLRDNLQSQVSRAAESEQDMKKSRQMIFFEVKVS